MITSKNTFREVEDLKEDIKTQLSQSYGTRLKLNELKRENNSYLISLNYLRSFQIIDYNSKTVYIRAINIPNIYELEVDKLENIEIPRSEINDNIKDYFRKLQQNISNEVLLNENLIIKLFKPTLSHIYNNSRDDF